MDKDKQQALEAAGFVFGDAEDFLELTAEERERVEAEADDCPLCEKYGRVPNARTIRAIHDADAGKVTRYKDVDDMFRKLGVKFPKKP